VSGRTQINSLIKEKLNRNNIQNEPKTKMVQGVFTGCSDCIQFTQNLFRMSIFAYICAVFSGFAASVMQMPRQWGEKTEMASSARK
jgi:hypothetical protein